MNTRNKIKIVVFLLLFLLAAILYLTFQPVTNSDLRETILEESALIRAEIRDNSEDLKAKLDRVESKLDRLLSIAASPDDTRIKR